MLLYKKIGNIKVYTECNRAAKSVEVSFYNGSDLVNKEVYFNATKEKAVDDLLCKIFGIHTESYVKTVFSEKYTNNTYSMDAKNWFCRIDKTKYFKHFNKSVNDFIRDKDGQRIIDR